MKIALSLLALPAVFGLKTKENRKLQNYNYQQGQYDQADMEFMYLQGYEQVYVTCDATMSVMAENGEYEYGAVLTRLCPTGATCDASGLKKCSSGYGDYVVGIQTYLQSFLEQFQREQEQQQQYNGNQNNNGMDFDFGDFGECKEFKVENQNQQYNQNQNGEEVQYFAGPLCEDGDIKIALFSDENCQYKSALTFYDLTGINLPWSDGIMHDEGCKGYYCYGMDQDGNYDFNDLCTDIVEQASLKCEEKMETTSMYGPNVNGCESIKAMLPNEGGKKAGLIIGIILIIAVVGFGAWYFMQKKKAAVSQEGLMM